MRKRAHLSCCVCRAVGVEIHHILPQAEDGPDSVDNAAPLCPSCHDTYGSNRSKRKFIREARDIWYEICDRRYAPDADRLERIETLLRQHVRVEPAADEQTRSTLGEVLTAIYDSVPEDVPSDDIEFIYDFVFGGVIGDESVEECKRMVLERLGAETAKRICAQAVSRCDFDLSVGFTEEEISEVAGLITTLLICLAHHHELDPPGFALTTLVEDDGEIRFYSKDTDDPDSGQ